MSFWSTRSLLSMRATVPSRADQFSYRWHRREFLEVVMTGNMKSFVSWVWSQYYLVRCRFIARIGWFLCSWLYHGSLKSG